MNAYARILRAPHMRPLFLSMLLTRLPLGLNGLATVLFLRERTGSFAVAGAAAGALALGNAVGAPLNARLVDRLGSRVLLMLAAGHAAGLLVLPVGFGFGALEVAIPAFASAHGRPGFSGVLIAIWSIASAAGGLVYGARSGEAALSRVHVGVALLLPVSFIPLALAGTVWTMALLVIPAGALIAPLIASRNELAGAVAPPDAETEAFTWPLTALVGGVALGAAAAGSVVEASGWRAAVVVAVAAAALGALVALARRATLEPASAA
jgi:MFS family permease